MAQMVQDFDDRFTSETFTFELLPDIDHTAGTAVEASEIVTVTAPWKVVGSLSDSLRALFTSPMKESKTRTVSFVSAGVRRETFLKVLQFSLTKDYKLSSDAGDAHNPKLAIVGHARVHSFACLWDADSLRAISFDKFFAVCKGSINGDASVEPLIDAAQFIYRDDPTTGMLITDEAGKMGHLRISLLACATIEASKLSKIESFINLLMDSASLCHDFVSKISQSNSRKSKELGELNNKVQALEQEIKDLKQHQRSDISPNNLFGRSTHGGNTRGGTSLFGQSTQGGSTTSLFGAARPTTHPRPS